MHIKELHIKSIMKIEIYYIYLIALSEHTIAYRIGIVFININLLMQDIIIVFIKKKKYLKYENVYEAHPAYLSDIF
jgi:hypothetical protein